jgi:hypothetical protein
MSKRRIIVLACTTALPIASLFVAPSAGNAATCVGTRTWIDGNMTGNYNCAKTDSGDICAGSDRTVDSPPVGLDDTGAGVSACYESPVVR